MRTLRRLVRVFASPLLLAGGLVGCAATHDSLSDTDGFMRVFTSASMPATAPALAAEPWAVRFMSVEVNPALFTDGAVMPGDTLVVALFDDEQVQARVTAVDNVLGQSNMRARALAPEAGDVLLTIGRETVVGSIRLAARPHHFYVRHDADLGEHVLIEVDPEKEDILPEAPPEEEPP